MSEPSNERGADRNRTGVLVTGTMRSGTTFVGSVLAQKYDLFYLHEPFNPTWGIHGVNRWFPYIRDDHSAYTKVVDRFFDLDFTYRTVADEAHWAGWFKKRVGGKAKWRGKMYRYLGRYFTEMLVKDPLAALLSRYMHDEHDVCVVAMVRHPMGFYYSNKRLGWDFDLDELRAQPELLDDHLGKERPLLSRNDLTYPQRLAVLWRCINRVLHNYAEEKEDVDTWICKRHEDLCLAPIDEFRGMFERLGFDFNSSISQFIRASTDAKNPSSVEEETHQLQRDARKLAYYWKEEVNEEERDAIRAITEPVSSLYYNHHSWDLEFEDNGGRYDES